MKPQRPRKYKRKFKPNPTTKIEITQNHADFYYGSIEGDASYIRKSDCKRIPAGQNTYIRIRTDVRMTNGYMMAVNMQIGRARLMGK